MTDYSAIIRDHLAKQRAKSSVTLINGQEVCRYRGEDGMMCAVGCLIPDDKYDPEMEGVGILKTGATAESSGDVGTRRGLIIAALPAGLNINLASDWQAYHDYECHKFSYDKWLLGDEDHSPDRFYTFLQETYHGKA